MTSITAYATSSALTTAQFYSDETTTLVSGNLTETVVWPGFPTLAPNAVFPTATGCHLENWDDYRDGGNSCFVNIGEGKNSAGDAARVMRECCSNGTIYIMWGGCNLQCDISDHTATCLANSNLTQWDCNEEGTEVIVNIGSDGATATQTLSAGQVITRTSTVTNTATSTGKANRMAVNGITEVCVLAVGALAAGVGSGAILL